MPTFATSVTTSSAMPVELPQSYMVRQQRQQISELQFGKFTGPQSFLVWKIRFKNQVTTCSDFHRMLCCASRKWRWLILWTSLNPRDQFMERIFQILTCSTREVASALNKIIQNSQFKKKVSLEEQKAQKEDRSLRERQIAFMIYDYFRVTGAREAVLDYADVFSITLRNHNVQEFDAR